MTITSKPWQSGARISIQRVLNDFTSLEDKSREDFDKYMKSLDMQYLQNFSSQTELPPNQPSIPSSYPPASYSFNRRGMEDTGYYQANPSSNRVQDEGHPMFQRKASPNIFPRNVKYFRDGNIPSRTDVAFPPRDSSFTDQRVPLYIPSPGKRRGSKSPEPELPHEMSSSERIRGVLDPARNLISTERRTSNYPHSFYPFPRGSVSGVQFESINQQYNMRRRKSPYGPRALQEIGGIEDAMQGLDVSLERNELRAVGPKYKNTGYMSWQEYKENKKNEFASNPQHLPRIL